MEIDFTAFKPSNETIIRKLILAETKLGVLYATTSDDGDEHTADVIREISNTIDDAIEYLKKMEDD